MNIDPNLRNLYSKLRSWQICSESCLIDRKQYDTDLTVENQSLSEELVLDLPKSAHSEQGPELCVST